ncbi:MAG: YlxR family protein [Elainellaceae cyanobacterium]
MDPNYRRCISCRRVAHKSDFWRVVRVSPSRSLQLDTGMGRSAYLCRCKACLQGAQRKNRLGKILKAPVPDHIYARLWERLPVDECSARQQS